MNSCDEGEGKVRLRCVPPLPMMIGPYRHPVKISGSLPHRGTGIRHPDLAPVLGLQVPNTVVVGGVRSEALSDDRVQLGAGIVERPLEAVVDLIVMGRVSCTVGQRGGCSAQET